MSIARVDTCYLLLGLAPAMWPLYAHSDKSRNNFLHAQTMASALLFESRTPILATGVTGSAFRGFILVLQNNSMLKDSQMFLSRMGAFRCIHTRCPSNIVFVLGEVRFRCLLRSDWVIAQLVRQNRLENRTSCNAFSPDFHVSGTFERHVTFYDWLLYRAIGRLRTGESYRVAAP